MGDALGALNLIALRDDAPALALRGIAMAQMGELGRARTLVRAAAAGFGKRDPLAHARCVVAESELALATRDLAWPEKTLEAAQGILESQGDRLNAAHARLIAIRRLVIVGEFGEAEQRLAKVHTSALPPALRATHALVVAAIAIRRTQAGAATAALARAAKAAQESGIPALIAEVERAGLALRTVAGFVLSRGRSIPVSLADVEELFNSRRLIVDACRHAVRLQRQVVSLARSPVLFTIARVLAEFWPEDTSRTDLMATAFRARKVDESHRVRLRVEIGRLRRALRGIAKIEATKRGYQLVPCKVIEVLVLTPPVAEENASVLALLADGEAWSSSALGLALGVSQRSVQRSLEELATRGKVQSFGAGRAKRWITPALPGIATALLLPAPLAAD